MPTAVTGALICLWPGVGRSPARLRDSSKGGAGGEGGEREAD